MKTGTVRLRADADKAGTMALDARGTRTVQVGRQGLTVPACPAGHESDDPDWCDVCGHALGLPPPPVPARGTAPACPVCGAALDGRFCERCGHDSTGPRPRRRAPGPARPPVSPASTTWRAVVRADPAWFDVVRGQNGAVATTLEFPRYCPGAPLRAVRRPDDDRPAQPHPRHRPRHRPRRRWTPPCPPRTRSSIARPDGWDLVDLGSSNGTTLAVEDGPIRPHTPVPLPDGAVIRLGAWTTITLTAHPPADPAPSQT